MFFSVEKKMEKQSEINGYFCDTWYIINTTQPG